MGYNLAIICNIYCACHLIGLFIRKDLCEARVKTHSVFKFSDNLSGLVAKCNTTLGQVDLWSDLWVRLTFGQMYPPGQRHLVAKCDTISGEGDMCIGGQVWCQQPW